MLMLASLMACLFAIATPSLAQQTPALVTRAVDNAVRTVLPGNVHPLARAEFDRGEASPDVVLHRMLLVLKRSPQQEAALRRLIEEQQYKDSPSYHQWLTPEKFGTQFGPADSDIAAVTNWLRAGGFQVAQVSKGRTVIEFSGTAGQVKQAFGTAIHKYVVKGEEHFANLNDPSIPTALAPVVAGVNTLHNFLKKAQNVPVGTVSREQKTGRVTSVGPLFIYNGQCFPTGENCEALGPYDFATIYDLLPLWTAGTDGTGQSIAIVGRTNVDPADATDFWNLFGLTIPNNKLKITLNGPDPGINGDEAEADIDIQWSGATAPGAIIEFVTSASTETTDGVDLSALYIVDNNVAPVMSESYGSCEVDMGSSGVGSVGFYGALWEQAAAQGISAMVSTGDSGSAGCDNPNFSQTAQSGLNVNGLGSTPFNVAVGGTDFDQFNKWSTYWKTGNDAKQANAKGYIPETTWNDSCTNSVVQFLGGTTSAEANCNNSSLFSNFLDIFGGSGGESIAWPKPPWQTGTPNDNSRDLPDVSLFAGSGFLGTFYIICQKDTSQSGACDLNAPFNDFQGYGGTSVSSPAFAGIMALVNQKWGVQGNPNFVLYKLPGITGANAFHDIPAGSTIAVPCTTGSPDCVTNTNGYANGVLSGFSTAAGYDLATGLGSVDAANLVSNWNKVTFTPTTTTLTLPSNVNVTHGSAVTVTVAVSPSAATGDVSLLVSPGIPGKPSIDFASLTAGTVTFPTNLLPGGTYKVIAHYSGDGTFGGSYSSPSANVTVTAENSSVIMPGVVNGIDTNVNPTYTTSVSYGTGAFDQYLLRADVFNSQGAPCSTPTLGEVACPTGTISFTDNGSALDPPEPYKLNGFGYTEDQTVQLTGGSHTLVATYSGDASYKTGTATANITVAKATSLITDVQTSLISASVGQQFTVTATVDTGFTQNTSFGLAPTGTVSFFYQSAPAAGSIRAATPGIFGLGLLAGVFAIGIPGLRRRKAPLALLLLGFVILIASCGGGSSGPPPNPGPTQFLGVVQVTPTAGNFNSNVPASLGASLTSSIPKGGTYLITATYSGDSNYTSVTAGQSNSVSVVVH